MVLPAPDGDERTSISPRRTAAPGCACCPDIALLQVLHLLAELLDDALELQADIGEFDIVRLGAERVDLAIKLLREEIEPPADGAAAGNEFACLRNVRREPIQLFAHVRLRSHQDRLLMQPVGIEPLRAYRAAL